ncbi:MAG: hypothetical protein ACYCS1_05185 [Gammaproteobacteria bacterium]
MPEEFSTPLHYRISRDTMRLTKEQILIIKKMKAKKQSIAEISRELKIPYQTILYHTGSKKRVRDAYKKRKKEGKILSLPELKIKNPIAYKKRLVYLTNYHRTHYSKKAILSIKN